jgi:antitoxin StbD
MPYRSPEFPMPSMSRPYRAPPLPIEPPIIGSHSGADMEKILADLTVNITDFKKNPEATLSLAKNRPVAVLRNKKPAFYVLEPALFEAIMDELEDMGLHRDAIEALANGTSAMEVDIDDR